MLNVASKHVTLISSSFEKILLPFLFRSKKLNIIITDLKIINSTIQYLYVRFETVTKLEDIPKMPDIGLRKFAFGWNPATGHDPVSNRGVRVGEAAS